MKKQLKSGFTLAEVLITLAIIGVVAAIVMPSVIANYQYKTVGVKLSKFQATIENAARAYVVTNDSFKIVEQTGEGKEAALTQSTATDFLNDAIIYNGLLNPKETPITDLLKAGLNGDKNTTDTRLTIGLDKKSTDEDGNDTSSSKSLIGVMKDNTKLQALPMSSDTDAGKWNASTAAGGKLINTNKVGEGAFILVFDPAVSGLPKDIHRGFKFVVTELGYMFPAANDKCLWTIYDNNWTTNSKTINNTESGCIDS